MKTTLHRIADEQINPYIENSKFTLFLEEYNNNNNSHYDELWLIAYRCACNFLKKRFGQYWSYDEIEDLALEMVSMLFTRINNKSKYPNGYNVINLPKTIENIFLTIYYNKRKKFERSMISLEQYNENKYSSNI